MDEFGFGSLLDNIQNLLVELTGRVGSLTLVARAFAASEGVLLVAFR